MISNKTWCYQCNFTMKFRQLQKCMFVSFTFCKILFFFLKGHVMDWTYCYGVDIALRTPNHVNSIAEYETGSFGYEVTMSQLFKLSL